MRTVGWERGRLARKQAERLHSAAEVQAMFQFDEFQFALQANAGEPPALPAMPETFAKTLKLL